METFCGTSFRRFLWLLETYLSFSLKAVIELDNIWVLESSHDLDLPLEASQLFLRTTHFGQELQSHHLETTDGQDGETEAGHTTLFQH